MSLRTDYKDDVFTGKRKYRQTTNLDGTISFDDETDYTQQGDTYGAAQINAQNDLLNDLDSNAYRQTDGEESALSDNDYFPFFDTSANAKKKTLWSNIKSTLTSAFAIKVHDSNTASTYGAGTSSKFGHVKLSDNYTSSAGAANSSIGASSQAVYNCYANRAPINHASADTIYGRGSNSVYGHVKLSDNYTSSAGAASAGMGASSKAVNDSYNKFKGQLTANGKEIYMDYKNGKYGYNTSANRGADTFHPFSQHRIGEVVYANVSGSHTYNNYPLTICYESDNEICLLGNISLEYAINWNAACSFTWTVSFPAGSIDSTARTISNVKIPTLAQINSKCAGYKRDYTYYTSTESGADNAWAASGAGGVEIYAKVGQREAIPFVVVAI